MKIFKKIMTATLFALCTSSLMQSADSSNSSLTKDPLFLPVVFGSVCIAGYLASKALDSRCCNRVKCHKHQTVPKKLCINDSVGDVSFNQESWLTGFAKLIVASGITYALITRARR